MELLLRRRAERAREAVGEQRGREGSGLEVAHEPGGRLGDAGPVLRRPRQALGRELGDLFRGHAFGEFAAHPGVEARSLAAALLALSFTAGAQALGPEEEGPVTPLSPEAEHPETALAVLEQLARHHSPTTPANLPSLKVDRTLTTT